MKTDREKDGLVGPVQIVKTHSVRLAQQNDCYIEEPELLHITTYDPKGAKIKESSYQNDDSLVFKRTLHYDPNGRLNKMTSYKTEVIIDSEVIYIYDGNNRLQEETNYTRDGRVIWRKSFSYDSFERKTEILVFPESCIGNYLVEGAMYNAEGARSIKSLYDSDGNLTEVFFYDAENALISQIRLTYDSEANLIKDAQYTGKNFLNVRQSPLFDLADGMALFERVHVYNSEKQKIEESLYFAGHLQSKRNFIYDARGLKAEELLLGGNGSLKSRARFIYELNSLGDWVRETVSKWIAESDEFEPYATKYRKITYY